MTSSVTKQAEIDHAALSRQLLDELFDIQVIHPTGSSFTCDPPVLDTDIDFVCKVDNLGEFLQYAVEHGWETPTRVPEPARPPPMQESLSSPGLGISRREGPRPYTIGDFVSFRKENINLIVTERQMFFDKYVQATMLAKEFNLLDKDHRIKLFTAIVGQQREAEIT